MAEKLRDAVEKNRAKLVDPEPAQDLLRTGLLQNLLTTTWSGPSYVPALRALESSGVVIEGDTPEAGS